MRFAIIRVVMLAILLGALSSPALAALREVSRNSYPGELSNRTAQTRGDQFSPRAAIGRDPRRDRFFESRLMTWQQGQIVSLRLGSIQFVPQILIFAPSGQLLADSVDHSSVARGADGAAWVDVQYSVPRTMQDTVVATTLEGNAQGLYRLDVHVSADDGGGTGGGGGVTGGGGPPNCQCPPGTSGSGLGASWGQPLTCTNARGQLVAPVPPGCGN